MKKILFFLTGILISLTVLNGQEAPPKAFSFKALITKNGSAVANKTVYLQISILQDNINGPAVYAETFEPVTNDIGQVDLEIGRGTIVSGDFSAIDWSLDEYFLKIEYALKSRDPYQTLSTTQLLSVPYALYAGEASSAINESDPIFSTHPAFGITNDNITDWNAAYGWGNHEGLYRPIAYVPAWSEITSKPTTIAGFGLTDAVATTGDQTVGGIKSFSYDILVNGLTIGKGNNSISGNTAIGLNALTSNTTGNMNTATGHYALYLNAEGVANTAIGYNALFFNETGSDNTAIGANALYQSKGSDNTAIGLHTLYRNTDGYSNTAIGVGALAFNSTGFRNTANGVEALYSNTTGWFNAANGVGALYSNTDGKQNTAIGFYALYENITGFGNTAVGNNSGRNTTGDNNVFLGYNAGQTITTGSNNIAIGYNANVPDGTADNQIRMGNNDITYAGIQVAWTVTSDIRWKESVRDLPYGLNFVSKLKPVDYIRKNNESNTREVGFIAQDVEALLNELGIKNSGLIHKDSEGSLELRYNDFIPILTKAIQEQETKIAMLQKQNEDMRAKLSEMGHLKAELESIKSMVQLSTQK